MDPISNADRLMVLLRQRLQERAKASAGSRAAARKRSSAPAAAGLEALAAMDGADTQQLRRACIQSLLADQLGSALINDAQFQQVVSRVADAIGADAGSSRLLDRLLTDLRAGCSPSG